MTTTTINYNDRVVRQFAVMTIVWGIVGMLVGVIIAAQLASAHPATGETFELNAIAAVVLGGTSLMGGRGSIGGTIIGAFVIGVLADGLLARVTALEEFSISLRSSLGLIRWALGFLGVGVIAQILGALGRR